MITPLSVSTPLSDPLDTDIIFLRFPVLVEDRKLPVDLVLLNVIDFDVILGMDWLSQHYVTLDYCSKVVIFRITGEEEFKFLGASQNLISAIMARKMLRKECQGYLVLVRDITAEHKSISDVHVVCEFLDVFLDELSSLSPYREIEFCIDVTPGITFISMTPYRMAHIQLKELKEQLQELLDKGFI